MKQEVDTAIYYYSVAEPSSMAGSFQDKALISYKLLFLQNKPYMYIATSKLLKVLSLMTLLPIEVLFG